jgi:hypothetical protein
MCAPQWVNVLALCVARLKFGKLEISGVYVAIKNGILIKGSIKVSCHPRSFEILNPDKMPYPPFSRGECKEHTE